MPKPVDTTNPPTTEPSNSPKSLNSIERSMLEHEVTEVLRCIYDPEIPVNIYDLGLIYNVDVDEQANVHILMTLTSPACPVAGTLPGEVEEKVMMVPAVNRAKVEITWDPPFTIERMSEEVRLMLGLL